MPGEQLALAKHRRVLKAHKDHHLLPQRAVLELGAGGRRGQDFAGGDSAHHLGDVRHEGHSHTGPRCDLGLAESLPRAPSAWHEQGRCCPTGCCGMLHPQSNDTQLCLGGGDLGDLVEAPSLPFF